MPYQDLPFWHEQSALAFDLAHPCEIERYFEDLEFLFLKHQVSDDQEKQHMAVNYPSVAVEQLWKIACAFCDPTQSYKDFKVEIITLYPEATTAQEYTIKDLRRLVDNCAHAPICSHREFVEFYCEFLLVSQSLITKGRLSMLEQARQFLAGFGPHFSPAIHS